ncbi:uncharacterized protein LOC119632334 isoform X2 [Glossina fuscipes]|uniref:Uncharacterized protein LOC119632334 isoform X2 n=1 Tax=Glossina fuscipes TaxID=7396 RepID=A0A8U0W7C5_9MUSC|nr:uncharacterized protein LOC119632334 isoform X2 [Glossina fuscipes]
MKDLEINLENYTNERHPTSTIITNLTAEDYQNILKQKQTISSDRNSSSGCTLQEFCCSQSAKPKLRDIGSYSTSTSFTGSNQETLNQRPLFITTVPRGIFLPPPKEVFLIPSQHKKSLYAYSSHPVVYQASLRHQKQHIYNTHTGGTKVKTINVTTTTTTTAAASTTTTTTAKAISNCYKTVTSKSRVTLPKGRFQNVKYNNKADDINGSNGRNREDPIAINDKDKVMTIAIHNNNKNNSNSIHKQICKNNMREKCNRQSYVSVIGGDVDDNIGIHITKQQQRHQRQQQQSYHTKREIPPTEPYNDTISKENEDKNPLTNPLALLLDYNPFDKGAESKRRLSLRKRLGCQKKQKNFLTSHGTDRQRHNTKDNKLIEEITTRSPEIVLVDQSELFLEKPPLAPYVPFNVSVDASTEIADDELFHFEAEVQPIIEVLVDHTIDLSVIEVAHEKEISTIRRKMDVLLAQREVELAELRRLEAEDILLKAERTRRLRQEAIAKTLDEDRQQEVIAAKLLQGHIANVLPEILDSLEPAADADKKEKLMKSLCPWLSAEVATEVGQIINSREILTVIIKEIIKQRAEIYAGYQEKQPITETIDEEEYEICEIESNLAETESIQRCSPHI